MLHVRCSLVYNLVTLHEAHELVTRAANHVLCRNSRPCGPKKLLRCAGQRRVLCMQHTRTSFP